MKKRRNGPALRTRAVAGWCIYGYLCFLTGSSITTIIKQPTEITPPVAGKNSIEIEERSIIKAVNTMRCLTTPGCFPSILCSGGEKPMKLATSVKWEQHSFCNSDMKNARDNCLIYSFGLDKSTEWEERMAKVYGCDVYGFDPTSNFPEAVAPGVTFHKLGLQGAGANQSDTHSAQYAAVDQFRLRTLGEIVKFLGHEGRKIDILRLDCEGCEYGVLKQLACGGDSHLVNQLMIEFHFQKNLGLATDSDIIIGADALNCLEEDRWGVVSMQKRGCSEDDAEYTTPALQIIKSPQFLLFITLRRVHETAKLSYELYKDVVKAKNEELAMYRRKGPKSDEYKSKQEIAGSEMKKYNSLFFDRGGAFDNDIEVGIVPE